ncbi:hypothetical protein DSO57_1003827 [Entomophthora muscae]|uniref:Uncharacterized protein n=1 Tax=Entomophthora muscae TaxID=34485 RepID=A0ACC2UUE9_9FUNG|nr:hypothetical protein DSO57_1003827 [Entomophthora muscae]
MLKSFNFLFLGLSLFFVHVLASGVITSKLNNTTSDSSEKESKSSDGDSKPRSGNGGGSSSKISIPSNAARGMITMTEPPVAQNFIAGWAIGTTANMKWQFDQNLKVKPDNISIIAIRQEGGVLVIYNIGRELSGDTTSYEWDMAAFSKNATNPPLVESESYKLYIYDTARSYLAGAPPGGLNPYTRQFRLYQGSNGSCKRISSIFSNFIANICLQCLPGGLHSSSSMLSSDVYLLIFAALFHLSRC